MQNVTFKSNNLTIKGSLVLPDRTNKPYPGVIIFHGMTSSEAGYIPLAAALAEKGIAGLAISMRGHGKSGGDFHKSTVAEAINDALAAYDFLTSQPDIDDSRIGMVGSSVGAILSALAAQQRSILSIVFRAPAAYTQQMMQISMAETMTNEDRQFHEVNNLDNTPAGQAIASFKGSLLVVASENDTIIPPAITQGYMDIAKSAKQKELVIIKGASHNLSEPKWKEEFSKATVEWFTSTL